MYIIALKRLKVDTAALAPGEFIIIFNYANDVIQCIGSVDVTTAGNDRKSVSCTIY